MTAPEERRKTNLCEPFMGLAVSGQEKGEETLEEEEASSLSVDVGDREDGDAWSLRRVIS
jgi:hypothetical protein